ncbi:N-acetylglucosamine-specific PTS transporter subunit IIBC [Solimonas marina]|nr:N-acetylglucosamine-specific PTS transporter subunit IIBC [Solimonas marina]
MSMKFFAPLQKIGRALMLPIAVLPVAGLMLRFGQPDLLGLGWLADAGNAVFGNLPLIFAIGVAVGFAIENNGVAGLAAVIGYLVLSAVLKAIDPHIDMGVLAGVIVGVVAGVLYNRFRDIRLPEYLAFFGGKRFVPIVTGLSCLLLGAVFGLIWPPVQSGIDHVGQWLVGAGSLGSFVYLVLNRLLLVAGLHHILNSLVWFVFGSFTDASGAVVNGDLHRFFAGDPSAGAFMTGFFPIMMFGLPAACLAMYHAAPRERRGQVAGMLFSMALTSFLTGVTEPIEFTFMFLAPGLYALHALLTGISGVVMSLLHVRLGFTFSAGAIDYVLSFGLASHPLLLWPVGAVFAGIYYTSFRWAIVRFGLKTPGREPDAVGAASAVPADADIEVPAGVTARAAAFLTALGGSGNLLVIDACTTRLRLTVRDVQRIDEPALRGLGARGVLRPSADALQVVLGPQADIVAGELRTAARALPDAVPLPAAAEAHPPSSVTNAGPVSMPPAVDAGAWLAALGGRDNLLSLVSAATTRLRVTLRDPARVDVDALRRLGVLGSVTAGDGLQLIVGRHAAHYAEALTGG